MTRERMIKDLSKYIKADFSEMDFFDIAEMWEMFIDIDIEAFEKEIKGGNE